MNPSSGLFSLIGSLGILTLLALYVCRSLEVSQFLGLGFVALVVIALLVAIRVSERRAREANEPGEED